MMALPVRLQTGRDLGDRLANAVSDCFDAGYLRVVALGVDSPVLTDSALRSAIDRLRNVDLVLGPCHDGGYYVIGLSRPELSIFSGIDWGSAQVFQETEERAKALGLSRLVMEPLFDVDRPEDLSRLSAMLGPEHPAERTYEALLRVGTSPGDF